MQLGEVTSYNLKSQTILAEGWQELTEAQRIYIGKWERDVWPLVENINTLFEAELTDKQIDGIFTNAEQVAVQSGDNKTALGKAGKVVGDQAKKLQAQIDQLLKAAQNSGPVKNFDAQFEKLKAELKNKLQGNPMGQKILKVVDGYGGFAKENPAKAAFVIGAMTSVLAFASGGIVSGAAIGFFLKLASNTLKGDKLSTAVAKSVKGAAIGAAAGALGDALDKLLPAEVTNTFINDASGEIDISQLDGMDATSMADLDAESAKELIQTRSAMEELVARGNLDADAEEILQKQLDQVNDKIREIGDGASINDTVDAMQDEFGIKGTDVDLQKTTTTSDQDTDGVTTTEVVAELDAEQLNDAGINSADYPDNQWITDNTQKLLDAGLTEEQVEALQNAQGFNRALDQREFLGLKISASDSIITGDSIDVEGVPDDISVGQVFKSTVSKTLPDGTEYTGLVDTMIEGVDADGNPVYQIKSVFVNPSPFTEELDAALENLPEDLRKDLYDQVFKRTVSGSMEEIVDNSAANIVKAAAAVALGGALAGMEVKKDDDKKADAKEESIDIEKYNSLVEDYNEFLEDNLEEGPVLDKMKALAKAGANKVGDAMDKAGEKVSGAVGKAAGAVKSGAKQLANKVTKEKLMKMWTKMGKPTDMGSIVNILSDAGLSDESIGTVATNTKIPLKPQAKPDAGEDDPEAPTPGGATAKPGEEPKATDATAKPVDANKDGKDDKTGKVIQMPGTKPADGVDAPKSGIGKAIGDKQPKVPGTAGKTAIGDKQPKAPGTAGQKGSAPAVDVDIPGLADQIKKAGIEDQVKKQINQPPKAGASAGSGKDLGAGMQVDIPTLASQISDAGLQKAVKAQLTQKQVA
tara:strand:- start:13896 stop:16493 length:2598 start_codon:yes stop_codon:yes gene_type:complete